MADISPLEAGRAVVQAVKQKLDALVADLARLQKAEAMGKSLHGLASGTPSATQVADGNPSKSVKLTKTVFQIMKKGETFIDLKHSADPKKRDKDVGFEGKVPSDRKEKEVSADGSGGDIKKAVVDPSAPPKPIASAVAGMKTAVADMKAKVTKAGPDMGAKPPTGTAQPPKAPSAAPKGAAAGQPPAAPKAPGASAMTVKKEVGVFAHLQKKVK